MSSDELTLHYFANSFYSQKVLIGLAEKGIKYNTHHLVNHDYLYQPSFIKINPKCQVPMLQHGDNFIVDSVKILEYLENNFSADDTPRLYPDASSAESEACKKMCDLLTPLQVEAITYGCQLHPHLTRGSKLPGFIKKKMRGFGAHRRQLLQSHMEANPQLMEVYAAKIAQARKKTSEEEVEKAIEEVCDALAQVEQQLEMMRSKYAGSDDVMYWLVGPQFTVADIHLGVLLSRLDLLGLTHRFSHRVRCQEYLARIFQRPSCGRHLIRPTIYHVLLLPALQTLTSRPVVIMATVVGAAALLAALYWVRRRS